MNDQEWLAARFEQHRSHLRAVAYRMLGSLSEADDAVQDAWLRLSRSGADEIENLEAWLTTVVARVALNMLRSRRTRREEPFTVYMPEPIVDPADGVGPEHEALLADAVRAGAAGRTRHARAGRAAGVRSARHVRGAFRRDRRDRNTSSRHCEAGAGRPRPRRQGDRARAARRRAWRSSIQGLRQTPEQIATTALQEDADVVGLVDSLWCAQPHRAPPDGRFSRPRASTMCWW